MRILACALVACALSACGQPASVQTSPAGTETAPAAAAIQPWEAPNAEFEAVEPSIFGVFGSPTIWDGLAPLGRGSLESTEGSPGLSVNVRTEGEGFVADVLRTGLADDSVSAEHVRIEFRREVDGWYATNAYRRHQCARAADPEQWSTTPCP